MTIAKKIGIISIKGGVGKTSTVSSLGASLANDFNKRVLLVDANFSAPNLGIHLGLVDPECTIHHVLNNKAHIRKAIYDTGHGFHVLPGSVFYQKINPFKLREKLKDVEQNYDIIIIDSSPTLNEEILATMLASDELIVVTTPDIATLSTTLRAIRLAKQRKTPINGLILNRVYNKNFELSIEDIEETSGCDILAVIPHDISIPKTQSKYTPLTVGKSNRASREYKRLAGILAGEEYKESFFRRVISRFKNNFPKHEVNRVIFKENY